MIVRTAAWLIVYMWATNLHAQQKEILLKDTKFIRFSPSGLVDPIETNFSVGVEYRFADRWSFGSDAAWIFHSEYFEHSKNTNGFIVRPAIRRYFGLWQRGFVEAGLFYKYVVYKMQDWLGRDCVNGVPSYEEYTTFNYRKQALGLNINTGLQGRLSQNGKLWYEIYIGIGARYKWQGVINERNSCYTNAAGLFEEVINSEEVKFYPSIPMGVRLLYRLD